MSFLRSIALLAGVCMCVVFAYFFGHALSTHHARPLVIGAGLLVAGIVILAGLSRKRTAWQE